MHKGRLVVWEEDLHPPAPRSTRSVAIKANPGHRSQPDLRTTPRPQAVCPGNGALVSAWVEP